MTISSIDTESLDPVLTLLEGIAVRAFYESKVDIGQLLLSASSLIREAALATHDLACTQHQNKEIVTDFADSVI